MSPAGQDLEARAGWFREQFAGVRGQIARVIVGHDAVVDQTLICLFADGHVLLEGVPGIGKTLLVRSLAQSVRLKFSRIQFTPDLMPADITGTNILVEQPGGGREFRFQPGPIFAHIVLADEINRATPKTQSALLEAMQEHRVTTAGQVRTLEEPFMVLATQNPIEMEGTYPLPEAQLDRFLFKVLVESPSLPELEEIVDRTTGAEVPSAEAVAEGETVLAMRRLVREIAVAPHVEEFALKLIVATHPDTEGAPEGVRRFVRYGSSPRGAQALILGSKVAALLDGRFNVSFDDIRAIARPALRHRMILNFEGEAEGVRTDDLVTEALAGLEAGTRPKVEV